ncbi:MAG TPA: type III-A CRISPR-associated protein Csm2 [Armatimonadota bacterium]|nr:type III-A CRISPR-associated protein Csm2 [Armatimonadota bacterium]
MTEINRNHPRQQRRRQPHTPPRPSATLPPAYQNVRSYFDNGVLRREFLLDWAQAIAKSFEQDRLTTGQIRRFFTATRRIEQRLLLARKMGLPTDAILCDVMRLAPIAVYAGNRNAGNRNVVPEIFVEFIQKNVALVHSTEDFLGGFLPHFECVLGFANLRDR